MGSRATRTRQTKTTMNEDPLLDIGIIELLTRGPIGAPRRWAATLVLRMLEQRTGFGYRAEHRLAGEGRAKAALEVLRQALAALGPAEQQLMLRTVPKVRKASVTSSDEAHTRGS